MDDDYKTFDDWREVIDYIRKGGHVWYHAPLDLRPVRVEVKASRGRVRVYPGPQADPFYADAGHLDRFRRPWPGYFARRNRSGMATPIIEERESGDAFIVLAGPQRFGARRGLRWTVRLGVKDGCAYGGCCLYKTLREARAAFERFTKKS